MPAIDIPQTYFRMGLKTVEETVRPEEIAPERDIFSRPDYGMMLIWPQEYAWLKIAVQSGDAAWTEAAAGNIAFERICAAMGTAPARLKTREPSQCRAGLTARGQPLQLTIEINTSHRGLREFVRDYRLASPQATDVKLTLKLVAFDSRESDHKRPFNLVLNIAPLVPLPAFEGYVAIDLGNFSTGIATLGSGQVTGSDILGLDAEGAIPRLQSDPKTLASLVRIDGITTWYESKEASDRSSARVYPDEQHPNDDLAPSCRWVAGEAAKDGRLARQLAGAKRLLGRLETGGTIGVPVEHQRVYTAERSSAKSEETVQVRSRLPAELLAARVLEKFSHAVRFGDKRPAGWPRYLAVTYPTSYAPPEIHALRTAIHRAWLRATHEYQSPRETQEIPGEEIPRGERERQRVVRALQRRLDPGRRIAIGEADDDEDHLIRLLIDEATAASFYFLFRFAAESPGGLMAFRYQYPEGMNLLLYDCGGGTTDIALVQARVTSGSSDEITLKVLGRSGVRHFGGDDITWAVCKLLKAKIAALAIKEKGDRVAIPFPKLTPADPADPHRQLKANAEEVKRFLDAVQQAGPAKIYVPTEFDPTDTSPASEGPRERAMTLWTWGEQLKHHLAKPSASVSLGMFEAAFARGTGKLHGAILDAVFGPTASGSNVKAFGEAILKLPIHRDEIDAMIARPVIRTLACCRSLIEQKLPGERDAVAPVVHKVAVTGNASRYPLIREMLLERLKVSELEPEHWFHYEEKELKNAVAKGAVQALAAMSGVGINKFRFDTKMSECLPFDVAYLDFRLKEFPRLYPQQMNYADLAPKTIPLVGTEASNFTLYKRFPGDGDVLENADKTLPAFEGNEFETALANNHGYTVLGTWGFAEKLVGSVTVKYDAQTHTFGVADANGAEGTPIPTHADDLRARAPHERGTL